MELEEEHADTGTEGGEGEAVSSAAGDTARRAMQQLMQMRDPAGRVAVGQHLLQQLGAGGSLPTTCQMLATPYPTYF